MLALNGHVRTSRLWNAAAMLATAMCKASCDLLVTGVCQLTRSSFRDAKAMLFMCCATGLARFAMPSISRLARLTASVSPIMAMSMPTALVQRCSTKSQPAS